MCKFWQTAVKALKMYVNNVCVLVKDSFIYHIQITEKIKTATK
jgi:hypothetical protein